MWVDSLLRESHDGQGTDRPTFPGFGRARSPMPTVSCGLSCVAQYTRLSVSMYLFRYAVFTGWLVTLACFPQVRADPPVKTIDLLTTATDTGVLMRIYGAAGNGSSGVPVAGGYDCDGDGYNDMGFAGIRTSPLGRNGAGEVLLVFGSGVIGGEIDTSGFSSNILKIAGDQVMEVAGAEIWIDDVTGDGLGDLLICRQNYTQAAGREGAGGLSILVGGEGLRQAAEQLQHLDLRSPPTNVTHCLLTGSNAYDRLGIWVRTDDVNGDGIADIVVGSDEVDAPGESNRGAVYVVQGGPHLAVNQTNDFFFFGSTALTGKVARVHPSSGSGNYHLGATVQTGDLDGNGRAEVMAAAALNRAGAALRLPGAPAGTGQASGGAPRGKLFIAWDDNFPAGDWPVGYEFALDAAPGSTTSIQGDSFNGSFAEEILGGLDYDGDGAADLFTGDLVADGINGTDAGVGHVFFGAASLKGLTLDLQTNPTNVNPVIIEGPNPGAIGADTVTHGDYDADGIADILIGNPHDDPQGRLNAGTTHILYGRLGGWPAVIDLANNAHPPSNEVRIVKVEGANGMIGADRGDTLCYSAAAGDIDQDGVMDILVNEMVGNGIASNTVDVGNLLVISGRALLPTALRLQELQWSPGPVLSTYFYSSTGSTYRIDQSELLQPAVWSNISGVVTGTGLRIDFSDTSPSGAGTEFYRLVENP